MVRASALTAVLASLAALAITLPACMADDDIEDGIDDAFPSGKADGGFDATSPEALGALAFVNDVTVTADVIKAEAHLSARAAKNITAHRDGADGKAGTADDDAFDTLAELDAVPYIGPASLSALVAAAEARGLVHTGPKIHVVFSPQPAAASSNVEIAAQIASAQHSVDIAIYSYSDAGIATALRAARARGVKVRFLFDTASTDHNLKDAARAASKSAKIEADGIDVRYVNQVLHHKFLIVDGPRDDAALAATAKVVMGSANWSSTGGTVFDENTMVIENSAELAAAYQHEFDQLWTGSRDFIGPAPAGAPSTANITPSQVPDDAGIEALFTSANFAPGGSDGATWKVNKDSLAMASVWVTAIQNAQTSIHIASTHLRMRPIVDALVAKKKANPAIQIQVYLDQQEWISTSGDTAQKHDLAACQTAATTPATGEACLYNDFLFSKAAVDAGLDVRFKTYSYRWDATYAVQMHSKYMVVDGKELLSGSYNLSMNSEHGTFENALHVTGASYAPLVTQFEGNFASIFATGRDANLLAGLRTQISTDATIPLFFPSMALTWSEVDALHTLVRANCSAADSTDYRTNPPAHKTCPR